MFIKLKAGKVKPGKLNLKKVGSDRYPELDGTQWDEEVLTEIAKQFKLTKSEVRHVFIMYRKYLTAKLYDTTCDKPLHEQYTGYRIPGFGYFTIDKKLLYSDLHADGIISTEYAKKMVGKGHKVFSRTGLKKECTKRRRALNEVRKLIKQHS